MKEKKCNAKIKVIQVLPNHFSTDFSRFYDMLCENGHELGNKKRFRKCPEVID